MLQIFGKDTVLKMGGKETTESREQWLEDIEMKVGSMFTLKRMVTKDVSTTAK